MQWLGRMPPDWNRVKVSENLGAIAVAPVAPAVTSLPNIQSNCMIKPHLYQKFADCRCISISLKQTQFIQRRAEFLKEKFIMSDSKDQ